MEVIMFPGGMILVLFLFFIVVSTIKILKEYERAVVFRLGRSIGIKGPGLILLIPLIDQMRKVDMRTITMDIQPQDAITKDNVTIKVNAVVYFRVVDAEKAIIQVEDYYFATSQLAQTTLRSVMGQVPMDHLLESRESINHKLQEILDKQTDNWGIKISGVEVKDIDMPKEMQRAMAREAEAERERRAKVISAEGEVQRSEALAKASAVMSSPTALQLAYLQTLTEITKDRSSTIIFPIPMDILKPFMELGKK
jgi:regulator of protease activity HflC (stomatin/prohibitin superfamily)